MLSINNTRRGLKTFSPHELRSFKSSKMSSGVVGCTVIQHHYFAVSFCQLKFYWWLTTPRLQLYLMGWCAHCKSDWQTLVLNQKVIRCHSFNWKRPKKGLVGLFRPKWLVCLLKASNISWIFGCLWEFAKYQGQEGPTIPFLGRSQIKEFCQVLLFLGQKCTKFCHF